MAQACLSAKSRQLGLKNKTSNHVFREIFIASAIYALRIITNDPGLMFNIFGHVVAHVIEEILVVSFLTAHKQQRNAKSKAGLLLQSSSNHSVYLVKFAVRLRDLRFPDFSSVRPRHSISLTQSAPLYRARKEGVHPRLY